MKPWTVILKECPESFTPSYTREAFLPYNSTDAWDRACNLYGKNNVLAILPGSFKNRVYAGFISKNP